MGSGSYAVCRLAVVPVRLLPGHRSETTSQVRCGESVEVLETRGAFARVRILSDGYEGWVDSRQFTAPGPDFPAAATHVTDDICGQAILDSRRLLLPLGTPLPDWKDGAFSLGKERWQWTGKVRALPQGPPDVASLLEYAHRYLHTAYLWGGRSAFGIDCSGFVQAVWQAHGQKLARDTVDQVSQGQPVAALGDAVPGDLVFFNCAQDEGTHVGLLLGCGTIIHGSAMVRVDDITDAGIRHRETGTITHLITAIRRFF